ncbi:MAG: 2-dehydropantoate 2-reductase [Verrucomicrobiaceae bacterium]|nr:2-dehydropantoate 2-reductase [Verrucomicrobiaceae bacterium]
MRPLSTLAVVGSGSVGSYYGARLALHGEVEVSFLMRRDLEAVREKGLRVRSIAGDFQLDPVRAFATTEEIGPVDLVLIALKTTANDALGALLAPLLKPDTILLTLQNGLGNEAFLHAAFPAQPVLGGLCFVCINRGEPGVIHHLAHGRVEMGEFTPTGTVDSVAALFTGAGLDCHVLPDLGLARWRKLIWNVPFNGLSIAAGGLDTRRILAVPALLERTRALMHEIIAIAAALGHEIDPAFAESNIRGTREMGPYQPSSLIDFLAGNAVEVEAIWGEPLRQALAHDVSAPELTKLYHEIRRATGTGES